MDPKVLDSCLHVVQQAMNQKCARTYFNEPVDVETYPLYRQSISQPMDLGTIHSKLRQNGYLSAADVYKDIKLVWNNCRQFNIPGSDVYGAAEHMDQLVDRMWREVKLDQAPSRPNSSNFSVSGVGQPHRLPSSFQLGQIRPVGGPGSNGLQQQRLVYRESRPSKAVAYKPQPISDSRGPPQMAGYPSGGNTSMAPYEAAAAGALSYRHATASRLSEARGPGCDQGMDTGASAEAADMKRLSHPMSKCLNIIEECMRHPFSAPFRRAQDSSCSNLPMPQGVDLEAVRQELLPGLTKGWGTVAYKSVHEVFRAVMRTWGQYRSFYARNPSHPMHAQCDGMETVFLRYWRAAGLPEEHTGHAKAVPFQQGGPLHMRALSQSSTDAPGATERNHGVPATCTSSGLPYVSADSSAFMAHSSMQQASADAVPRSVAESPHRQQSLGRQASGPQPSTLSRKMSMHRQHSLASQSSISQPSDAPLAVDATTITPEQLPHLSPQEAQEVVAVLRGKGRCEACLKSKKGRCGSKSAPKRCFRRTALEKAGLPCLSGKDREKLGEVTSEETSGTASLAHGLKRKASTMMHTEGARKVANTRGIAPGGQTVAAGAGYRSTGGGAAAHALAQSPQARALGPLRLERMRDGFPGANGHGRLPPAAAVAAAPDMPPQRGLPPTSSGPVPHAARQGLGGLPPDSPGSGAGGSMPLSSSRSMSASLSFQLAELDRRQKLQFLQLRQEYEAAPDAEAKAAIRSQMKEVQKQVEQQKQQAKLYMYRVHHMRRVGSWPQQQPQPQQQPPQQAGSGTPNSGGAMLETAAHAQGTRASPHQQPTPAAAPAPGLALQHAAPPPLQMHQKSSFHRAPRPLPDAAPSDLPRTHPDHTYAPQPQQQLNRHSSFPLQGSRMHAGTTAASGGMNRQNTSPLHLMAPAVSAAAAAAAAASGGSSSVSSPSFHADSQGRSTAQLRLNGPSPSAMARSGSTPWHPSRATGGCGSVHAPMDTVGPFPQGNLQQQQQHRGAAAGAAETGSRGYADRTSGAGWQPEVAFDAAPRSMETYPTASAHATHAGRGRMPSSFQQPLPADGALPNGQHLHAASAAGPSAAMQQQQGQVEALVQRRASAPAPAEPCAAEDKYFSEMALAYFGADLLNSNDDLLGGLDLEREDEGVPSVASTLPRAAAMCALPAHESKPLRDSLPSLRQELSAAAVPPPQLVQESSMLRCGSTPQAVHGGMLMPQHAAASRRSRGNTAAAAAAAAWRHHARTAQAAQRKADMHAAAVYPRISAPASSDAPQPPRASSLPSGLEAALRSNGHAPLRHHASGKAAGPGAMRSAPQMALELLQDRSPSHAGSGLPERPPSGGAPSSWPGPPHAVVSGMEQVHQVAGSGSLQSASGENELFHVASSGFEDVVVAGQDSEAEHLSRRASASLTGAAAAGLAISSQSSKDREVSTQSLGMSSSAVHPNGGGMGRTAVTTSAVAPMPAADGKATLPASSTAAGMAGTSQPMHLPSRHAASCAPASVPAFPGAGRPRLDSELAASALLPEGSHSSMAAYPGPRGWDLGAAAPLPSSVPLATLPPAPQPRAAVEPEHLPLLPVEAAAMPQVVCVPAAQPPVSAGSLEVGIPVCAAPAASAAPILPAGPPASSGPPATSSGGSDVPRGWRPPTPAADVLPPNCVTTGLPQALLEQEPTAASGAAATKAAVSDVGAARQGADGTPSGVAAAAVAAATVAAAAPPVFQQQGPGQVELDAPIIITAEDPAIAFANAQLPEAAAPDSAAAMDAGRPAASGGGLGGCGGVSSRGPMASEVSVAGCASAGMGRDSFSTPSGSLDGSGRLVSAAAAAAVAAAADDGVVSPAGLEVEGPARAAEPEDGACSPSGLPAVGCVPSALPSLPPSFTTSTSPSSPPHAQGSLLTSFSSSLMGLELRAAEPSAAAPGAEAGTTDVPEAPMYGERLEDADLPPFRGDCEQGSKHDALRPHSGAGAGAAASAAEYEAGIPLQVGRSASPAGAGLSADDLGPDVGNHSDTPHGGASAAVPLPPPLPTPSTSEPPSFMLDAWPHHRRHDPHGISLRMRHPAGAAAPAVPGHHEQLMIHACMGDFLDQPAHGVREHRPCKAAAAAAAAPHPAAVAASGRSPGPDGQGPRQDCGSSGGTFHPGRPPAEAPEAGLCCSPPMSNLELEFSDADLDAVSMPQKQKMTA